MPAYDDLTKEQLDEMSMEERYPGIDESLDRDPRSGPYKIVWDTPTPTSHTRMNAREIWINQRDIKSRPSSTLAHEIAHSKLLKQGTDRLADSKDYYERFQLNTWREVEAILLTLGKGQSVDTWYLGYAIFESTKDFGDGSAKDGKRVVKTIAKRLGKRGFLTKAEVSKVLGIINRYKVNFSEYEA